MKTPLVIVVMGVSGSGKTTVGRMLAADLGWRFHDADDDHSPENIEQMRQGRPLGDVQRLPWLDVLSRRIQEWIATRDPCVLACSALTVASRRTLRAGSDRVRFVHLRAELEVIRKRLQGRSHFMPASLVESQFETLEDPQTATTLNADTPPEVLVRQIRHALRL